MPAQYLNDARSAGRQRLPGVRDVPPALGGTEDHAS
jgi:hypothetical protein